MRYARPAVYVERPDAVAPEPVVLRTDVTGLVGIARRGPLDTAVPVESFRQFVAHFGEPTGAGYLAYAVRGFFENGGRRCWAVRVANRDDAAGAHGARVRVDDTGTPSHWLWIAASSPGSWGNALTVEWAQESGPAVVSLPAASAPGFAAVPSIAGFEAGTLVRIETGAGDPPHYRVVTATDGERGRLYWVHPEPGRGRPTDRPLREVDPTRPLRLSRVAYALTVREGGRVRAVYRDLHLVSFHPRYIADVLRAPDYRPYWLAPDGRREADLPRPAEPVVVTAGPADPARIPQPLAFNPGEEIALHGGRDGLAALRVDDFIGEPVAAQDNDEARIRKTRGLQALSAIDQVAIVAMPDLLIRPAPDPHYAPVPVPPRDPCVQCPPPVWPPRIHQPLPPGELPPVFADADIARAQSALLDHCETLGDRFALLSLPFDLANQGDRTREQIVAWRRLFDSRYGALYAPWLDVVDPRRLSSGIDGTRRIPACGHIAGVIARTDLESGVHHAPGHRVLHGVTDLSRVVGDDDHGELNLSGVNVLRGEFGRPPTLSGARTLSFDPQWRFINVMRLVMTVRKAAEIALRWVVFEPNDHTTRAIIAATLNGLLQLFFERGAFKGATPDESYFVRCDDVTTSPDDRSNGRLIAVIGIAPSEPCEFIVLRVGRERNAIAISVLGEPEAAHA